MNKVIHRTTTRFSGAAGKEFNRAVGTAKKRLEKLSKGDLSIKINSSILHCTLKF